MSADISGKGRPPKPKVVKEYVQNDFTVFNAYMDGLVEREAATVKYNSLSKKLKILILILTSLLILTLCVFIWILSKDRIFSPSSVIVGTNAAPASGPTGAEVNPEAGTGEQGAGSDAAATDSDAGVGSDLNVIKKSAKSKLTKKEPAIDTLPNGSNADAALDLNGTEKNLETGTDELGGTGGDQVASKDFDTSQVIRNYTIFTKVNPNPKLENIKQVVTGLDYEVSNNYQSPVHQHCQVYIGKSNESSFQVMKVGDLKKNTLKPKKIVPSESNLLKNKITRKMFDKLYRYCRFEILE